jgi:hypothetical protein
MSEAMKELLELVDEDPDAAALVRALVKRPTVTIDLTAPVADLNPLLDLLLSQ